MDGLSPSTAETCLLLREGTIRRQQGILAGWNSNFLLEVQGAGARVCRAIYKPQRGESHLWDFPPGTLYQREYLAFRISDALRWDLVPPTVVRDGPYGVGSVQLFVEAERGKHFFNLADQHRDAMVRIAILDCIINNADRKGGHVLRDLHGRIWAIDHGLSLLAEPKLRTVMWDLAGEPVPDDLRGPIEGLCHDRGLRDELEAYLTARELEAFEERVTCVLAARNIPLSRYADSWRPYPWPPI